MIPIQADSVQRQKDREGDLARWDSLKEDLETSVVVVIEARAVENGQLPADGLNRVRQKQGKVWSTDSTRLYDPNCHNFLYNQRYTKVYVHSDDLKFLYSSPTVLYSLYSLPTVQYANTVGPIFQLIRQCKNN